MRIASQVVQAGPDRDPHSADAILQQLACNSLSTLSMTFSMDGETIIPVAAVGSQNSSVPWLGGAGRPEADAEGISLRARFVESGSHSGVVRNSMEFFLPKHHPQEFEVLLGHGSVQWTSTYSGNDSLITYQEMSRTHFSEG